MKRNENETYLSFAERATQALALGTIGYVEWSESVLGEAPYAEETLRRCSLFFSRFLDKLNDEEIKELNDDDRVADIQRAKADLERERMKLHQENLELRETYRWEARNELYKERLIEAINRLEPMSQRVPRDIGTPVVNSTGLICLSDFHAGNTYEVKGLYGEIVNKYDFDIMKARLWRLLDQIETDDMSFDDITVAMLGDCFENVLRISSLTKLREPVVDTVIRFSEFMAEWLVEAQKELMVPINVVTIGGNHDVNRLLGSKPMLEDENLTKIVVEFLKLRLKDCPDILVDDYTDVALKNIRGTNVLFQHGEDKDLSTTIDYFSNLYNTDCDEIIAGHLHRPESKTIGITDVGDRVITRVGSICGIDSYAKKIRTAARPSAYMAVYTEDGKTWQRNYYL